MLLFAYRAAQCKLENCKRPHTLVGFEDAERAPLHKRLSKACSLRQSFTPEVPFSRILSHPVVGFGRAEVAPLHKAPPKTFSLLCCFAPEVHF